MPAASDLNLLPIFAAVAEQGSFTAAADRLGVAKAKVSLAIARLEREVGQTLLARTTRRVALTEAGRTLYAECVPPLRAAQDALTQFGAAGELSGTLRIAAPIEYAAQRLAPVLAKFAAAHPALEIDLRTSERVVDMLQEGIDVAVRLGWLRDSSLRAVRLGEFEQFAVAAPAYLRRMPPIREPRDLAAHEWVALTLLPSPWTWKFTSARGAVRTVRVAGSMRTDSIAALRGLVEAGSGVTVMDAHSAAAALQAGRLVRVLPDWSLPKGGVHAVFPPGRHVPAKTRAFIEALQAA